MRRDVLAHTCVQHRMSQSYRISLAEDPATGQVVAMDQQVPASAEGTGDVEVYVTGLRGEQPHLRCAASAAAAILADQAILSSGRARKST